MISIQDSPVEFEVSIGRSLPLYNYRSILQREEKTKGRKRPEHFSSGLRITKRRLLIFCYVRLVFLFTVFHLVFVLVYIIAVLLSSFPALIISIPSYNFSFPCCL